MNVSNVISIVSVCAAIIFGFETWKRGNTKDTEQHAVETATINVKLDAISSDVRDIKYDNGEIRKSVQGLSERMIVVEQSVKAAHHRIDEITENDQ